jgi:hypothetical protein
MSLNFFQRWLIRRLIVKHKPSITVVLDNAVSDLSIACLQLSTLTRAHKITGQGKNIYEAIVDGCHLTERLKTINWLIHKQAISCLDLPNSILAIGLHKLDEVIKISVLVLPPDFSVKSQSAWFGKIKKVLHKEAIIICQANSLIHDFLNKKCLYKIITYGLTKNADVGADDIGFYQHGYRWKLVTDGKILPMALNGLKNEKQVLIWLAAIAMAKSAGSTLTSILAQFETVN